MKIYFLTTYAITNLKEYSPLTNRNKTSMRNTFIINLDSAMELLDSDIESNN